MILSEHFSLREITRSATARRHKIGNALSIRKPEHKRIIDNYKAQCNKQLEPLRHILECTPINITSGYRSPRLNRHRFIGGARNSEHLCRGGISAVDIQSKTYSAEQIYNIAMQFDIPFRTLIYERKQSKNGKLVEWVHISYDRYAETQRQKSFIIDKTQE